MHDDLNKQTMAERPAGGPAFLEEEDLRGLLAEWRQSVHTAAGRPEAFWQWQQRAIAARRRRWARPRLVWATAMAALALTAGWLNRTTPPQPAAAQIDPDQALLADIETSVRREVPRALEPATLLTQEIDRAAQPQPNP